MRIGIFLGLFLIYSACSNQESPELRNGGGCSYVTKEFTYYIDSFGIENDSIKWVHFVSDSLDDGEQAQTTIGYTAVIIELYKSSESLELDSFKNAKTPFLIEERFIYKGACNPYSLDKIEVVKN